MIQHHKIKMVLRNVFAQWKKNCLNLNLLNF
jgi:hypothetical protein